MARKRKESFVRHHSLSIVSICILIVWILLYRFSDPTTHWGGFFGNAIADWTGLVVMILATKWMYERGSEESKQPAKGWLGPVHQLVRDHSLTIFFVITGAAWTLAYIHSDPQGRWGQVVGNIVSEWTQIVGLVLLTKKLMETGSKE
jgi:hypothetical protein